MCGEKSIGTKAKNVLQGSPPHVRGKGSREDILGFADGITPACAGKSSLISVLAPMIWDHPRMCGEKSGIIERSHAKAGSPPHVRGKVSSRRNKLKGARITPACAGKSS